VQGELAAAIQSSRAHGLRSQVQDLMQVFARLYEGHDRRTLSLSQPKPADMGAQP